MSQWIFYSGKFLSDSGLHKANKARIGSGGEAIYKINSKLKSELSL